MKQLVGILFLLLVQISPAQENEARFNKATDSYNAGDYEEAISSYLSIIEGGEHSAAVYFNLGNCYYKLNQIAPSIYYYEKALLLKPQDKEIKNNLAYAQNMTLDAIDPLPVTSLNKIYNSVTRLLFFDQWAYLAVFFVLVFVISYILFYYFSYSNYKRISFSISIGALIFSLVCILIAFLQYQDFNSNNPAIIYANEIGVKSEPNNRSPQVFQLHEGTKVNVLDKLKDWSKIELLDGKIGWVPSSEIKLLKDF
ncbi:SH3 domain-containing protein [Eudoraea chungangensis]|uniref:SH3 domain-containing protein n=1 Tax=Eudoraea chungangensis TaxID=1481905 RepID=UPI0023EC74C0|nr:SH3 domain-containing protein [Eudoraea chungangensis]